MKWEIVSFVIILVLGISLAVATLLYSNVVSERDVFRDSVCTLREEVAECHADNAQYCAEFKEYICEEVRHNRVIADTLKLDDLGR